MHPREARHTLERLAKGFPILDEVQRCPALLSWLQGVVANA